MDKLEKYYEMLKNDGADIAVRISASSVKTAAWTAYRCKYGCKLYGKSRCCPPNTPKWHETQDMIDCFSYGILFRCHENHIVKALAVKAAREAFLDGYYKVIAFGSGPCEKCKVCNIEQCNFPGETVPAMEACGIDVFATVRANGLEIETIRDIEAVQNHFGLILIE